MRIVRVAIVARDLRVEKLEARLQPLEVGLVEAQRGLAEAHLCCSAEPIAHPTAWQSRPGRVGVGLGIGLGLGRGFGLGSGIGVCFGYGFGLGRSSCPGEETVECEKLS